MLKAPTYLGAFDALEEYVLYHCVWNPDLLKDCRVIKWIQCTREPV